MSFFNLEMKHSADFVSYLIQNRLEDEDLLHPSIKVHESVMRGKTNKFYSSNRFFCTYYYPYRARERILPLKPRD